jgi:hypothetical protein
MLKAIKPGMQKFLVPNAPHAWLSEGNKFTLFEGKRALVAGEILKVISP